MTGYFAGLAAVVCLGAVIGGLLGGLLGPVGLALAWVPGIVLGFAYVLLRADAR